MTRQHVTVDGNEAAAYVAHATNEVIAIYPITPSSTMGELADAWSAVGRKNIYDVVPTVVEMQSEGGAAGACHGGLQGGALTTTFTASQGLLLMIPNMFKIAGELTSAVFHVAARSLATHALSIFGDHSDVMAARSTGWALLCSNTVQEVQDFALIAQAATLKARIPILHFFDGFRTSHEVNKLEQLSRDDMRAMLPDDLVQAHRDRALSPERPVLRGSAQNPDVFFQAREACNLYYQAVPGIVQQAMDDFAGLTGRSYKLFEYVGAPDAEAVAVAMGSGCGAIEETVDRLVAEGRKVGLVKIRLFRPFDVAAFLAALPTTTRRIAALDRTKEPGAIGEPLFQDVVTALAEGWADRAGDASIPRVFGGRYGLSSKDFTPAMVKAAFDELEAGSPRKHFTVGIVDDVTHLSLKWDPSFSTEAADVHRSVFYGLGSDGTVGANKNTVKIIGENTPFHAQGYFVYDSKKSGSVTVSHLRFSPRPIKSSYLVSSANFVACHQFNFLERMDVLESADVGGIFLLNSPYAADEVWEKIPLETQRQIIDRHLRFYVIDAEEVAQKAGLGRRINTIMQTCFFALSGVLPRDEAIAEIKHAIEKTYGKRGETVLQQNYAGVDHALAHLHEVAVPAAPAGDVLRVPPVPAHAPDFVKRVTAMMIEGRGDLLPVSALPVDGTFPTATAQYEKRSIALSIPIWDPEICIQCGLCSLVCPHAAIRTKAYPEAALTGAPHGYASLPFSGKEMPGSRLTVQVAPDDCTGCGVCVDVCPARSKEAVKHKAINMEPKLDHLDRERANFDFFLAIPEADRTRVKIEAVKGSQLLQPLFEFSGACPGCGETPYIKLMTQLFGDRAIIANATGCSSIYGGNLPTTPYTVDPGGRGPAWCNSLFEDNAEFGLGLRLAVDQQEMYARELVRRMAPDLGDDFVREILDSPQLDDAGIQAQRERVTALKQALGDEDSSRAIALRGVADSLIRRSVWIVGGDGWAYDIGFGGLDHVLASGRDVNILVLDTEVYSNTGGQASKSTPRAAVAKFASGGKTVGKKDLGMMAVDYGNVYVATVSMGANPLQTLKAFREAESYPGTSLIIAYSTCIAHGIDMTTSMAHQKDAVATGYWPLYRYDPRLAVGGAKPFHLDSRKPSAAFRDFALKEGRYAMLARANPTHAEKLLAMAQEDINERWHFYEQMAGVERTYNPMEDPSR
ncbi:pyruvate:ferredoxin (flavodoxin) oxidoreductase [Paludisphaera soli]|uniref:pyruvate:ferredoxin (flavodoxin) oxidoreductase n=1 Tax=Paludisphaera soli TaxID=2712865 RepID=UPI001980441B|nr:pyruvate:ferredoxin (flavodoxin) oxidoreductase [Paludisphaera soli]